MEWRRSCWNEGRQSVNKQLLYLHFGYKITTEYAIIDGICLHGSRRFFKFICIGRMRYCKCLNLQEDRKLRLEGYRDMVAFIATVRSPRLQERLERAISGRGAFRYFKGVLLDYPAERERWFQFKQERLQQRMLDWLESQGITPVDYPRKWKDKNG